MTNPGNSENIVYIDDNGDVIDDNVDLIQVASPQDPRSLQYDKNESYASFWVDRFGGLKWSSEGISKYRDALQTVSRTVNLTTNTNLTASKKEREISVRWSDGKKRNSVRDDVVYLCPDLIDSKTRRRGWSDIAVVDVLIGNALTESTYKSTATAAAEARISIFHRSDFNGGDYQGLFADWGRQLWYMAECLAAQKKVLEEFPGFSCYFQASKEYYTAESFFVRLQTELAEGKATVSKAVAATLWNSVNTDKPLSLPDVYRNPVATAQAWLSADNSDERAEATFRTLRLFRDSFEMDESQQQEKNIGNETSENCGLHSTFLAVVPNETGLESALAKLSSENQQSEETAAIQKIFSPDASTFNKNLEEILSRPDLYYAKKRQSVLPLIKALRNRLKIRHEDLSYYERGLRRGDLDEGSLYKLGFAPFGVDDPRVFEQKTIITKPSVAFIILVDESGSMAGPCSHQEDDYGPQETKIDLAMKSTIIAAEALKEVEGVKLAVLGHSTGDMPSRLQLFHHYTPKNPAGMASLGSITPHECNVDGYAIERACMYMLQWFGTSATKTVIHISDGYPNFFSYSGHERYGQAQGRRHVKKVCNTARQQGINVIALGIDSEVLTSTAMEEMYGTRNWSLLKNATALPLVLSNLISKTVKQDLHL